MTPRQCDINLLASFKQMLKAKYVAKTPWKRKRKGNRKRKRKKGNSKLYVIKVCKNRFEIEIFAFHEFTVEVKLINFF